MLGGLMLFKEQLNIINKLDKFYGMAERSKKHDPEKEISKLESGISELETQLFNDSDEAAKTWLEQILYHLKSRYGRPLGEKPDLVLENYAQFEKYRAFFQPDEETFKSRYQYLLSLCKLAYLEEKNGIPEEHAFKLSLLFDSESDAFSYLLTFMSQQCNLTKEEQKGKTKEQIASLKSEKERHEFNLHNACLFAIPSPDCDWKTWRKFSKSELLNKDFRSFLLVAEEIENLIKENTVEKASYNKQEKDEIIQKIKSLEVEIKARENAISALNKEIRTYIKDSPEYKEAEKKLGETKNEMQRVHELLHKLKQNKYNLTKEYDPTLIKYKTDELGVLNSQYKQKLGKQNTKGMSTEEKLNAKKELANLAGQVSEKRIEIFLLSAGLTFDKYSITQLACCAEFRKKQLSNSYLSSMGLSQKHVDIFLSLNREGAGSEIPDLRINGEQFSYPGIYLMKVDTNDLLQASRAAIIGMLTGCCQSIGGIGEPCAIHGLTSPYGGFYVVCQGDINSPDVKDDLLGACWVWRSKNNALCFDSIETNKKNDSAVLRLFSELSRKLVEEGHTDRVNCGARSGISYKLGAQPFMLIPEKPKDYNKYCDSHEQRLVYDKKFSFLFYDQYDFAKQDTEKFIAECFSSEAPLHENIPFCIMLNQLLINDKKVILDIINKKSEEQQRFDEVNLISSKIKDFSNDKIPADEILNNHENEFLLAAISGTGETLLQRLVKSQKIDTLNILLTRKKMLDYSINSLDQKGRSAVHYAILINNPEIIELLVKHGANFNLKDSRGNTPLMLAIKNNDTKLASYFMDLPDIDLNADDDDGNHPIMTAIQSGLTDIALQLIDKGAIIDEVNQYGQTALQDAVVQGNITVFNKILEKVPSDHIVHQNDNGNIALTLAIRYGHLNFVKILIDKLLTEFSNSIDLNVILPIVIESRNIEIFDYFVKNVLPDPSSYFVPDGNEQGHTLLTLLIKYGNIELFNKFIEETPPESLSYVISVGADKGHTPLTIAVQNLCASRIAKVLIDKIPVESLNYVIPNGKYKGYTPLALAIRSGNTKIINFLIEKIPPDSLNYVISDGQDIGHTLLTLAIRTGITEIVKVLIEKMPDQSFNNLISKDFSSLAYAIKLSNSDIAKILIDKISLNSPDALNYVISDEENKGNSLLTLAIDQNKTDIAKALIEKIETINPDYFTFVISEGKNEGHTPLTLAIDRSNADIAKTLIEKMSAQTINTLISGQGDKFFKILAYAVKYFDVDIVISLIEKISPEHLNYFFSDAESKGRTLLTLAMENGKTGIAKALIQKAPPDSLNYVFSVPHTNASYTPLSFAIGFLRYEFIITLIDKMSSDSLALDVHANSEGNPPLAAMIDSLATNNEMLAKTFSGYIKPVYALIKKLPPNSLNYIYADENRKGHSLLTLLIAKGRTDIAKALIQQMPFEFLNYTIPAGRYAGFTALTLAQKKKNKEIEKMLVSRLNDSPEKDPRPSVLKFSSANSMPEKMNKDEESKKNTSSHRPKND